MKQWFRYADGLWPNLAMLSITLGGYAGGVLLLAAQAWWLNVVGVLVVTQTLVWSAYYIHEFAHQAIFKSAQANERWGQLMTWITGSCYAPFQDLRRKHMRHHVERADVVTFDYRDLLRRHAWVRRTVLALEWLYVPAVELIMHAYVVLLPFIDESKRAGRGRMAAIVAARATGFALLGWWSLKALLLYAVAYLLFITVLRFADCFQHTYDAYPILGDQPIPQDKVRDRAYEQMNTYSNVVGLNHPVLNLLWLNFGYHNAHHDRPVEPWYRLPACHKKLYGDAYGQVVPVRELVRSFHINRVHRVLSSDYGVVQAAGTTGRADGFLGAVGVSFLTAV